MGLRSAHTTRNTPVFKGLFVPQPRIAHPTVETPRPRQAPIYRVAVPSPLRRLFDYLPPAGGGAPLPGCRVRVPFGNRQVIGLVIETATNSDLDGDKLKAISAVIDARPLVPDSLWKLYLWACDYYQHPTGDALSGILPVLLRRGARAEGEASEAWQLSRHGQGLPRDALPRARKQQQLLNLLRDQGPLTPADLKVAGISRAIIHALQAKGLVESVTLEMQPPRTSPQPLLREQPLALRPEQARALAAIRAEGFNPCLLQGETGSGKTEVYLQAIAHVLERGRQALVMIPEINLTPQTLARFKRRFACDIAVLHSGLTDRERLDAWQRARDGRAAIVIGTRSAVFTPLASPGILIVDEEHDGSYKQQEGFRYSARDLAVIRAQRESIPVVLGSATPSLESLANCQRGRYRRLVLKERPSGATQPAWQLIDIRGAGLDAGFSAPLLDAIRDTLEAGNQALVFVNRRGYAPLMLCHDCGWMANCHQCSARMTVHLAQRRLVCHHCETAAPLPDHCPSCHGPNLAFMGQGTERGEAVLEELFPGYPVLRVDRDSTRRKDAMEKLVDEVNRGRPCILVGTQMLAKGHHFPRVTLAALLDVDGGLFSPDFRAIERMGQLITQVAGRAGRELLGGRVILQSHLCDHPLVTRLTSDGYGAFAEDLLAQRRLAGLPPWTHLALVRAEAEQSAAAEQLLRRLRQVAEKLCPPSPELHFLGPLPSAMERRHNRFRHQLSLFSRQRAPLQTLLERLCQWLETDKAARRIRWSVDVDPQDML